MGALLASVGLGKTVAVGEMAGEGDTTSGVDVAGGVGLPVGSKLTIGVDEAGKIVAPVGGTLATGAGLHAAAKHTSKTVLNTYQRLFIWPSLLSTQDANLGSCAGRQVDDCFSDRSGIVGKILAACLL